MSVDGIRSNQFLSLKQARSRVIAELQHEFSCEISGSNPDLPVNRG